LSVHTNTHAGTQHHVTNHRYHLNAWDVLVKSDLLNVLILAFAFIYLGNKFLPKIVNERKNQISKELEEARAAKIKASEELEVIKQKTKQLTTEIENLKKDAIETAATIKRQIEQDTNKELEKLKEKMNKEIVTTREEAIQKLKNQASEAAVKLAEETISKISRNKEVQDKLVSDFLSEINLPSNN